MSTVAFSPDGLRVVTGDTFGTATLWDPKRPRRPAMTLAARTPQETTLWTVAFSPDGRTIVTAGGDEARLWGMGVDRPVLTLPRQPATVDRVIFSPDGMLMVTSGGGDVRVWRTSDGHSVAVLEGGVGKGPRPGVNTSSDAGDAVGFSRNGRRFLTIRGRGTSVWDTGSWDKVADLTTTPSRATRRFFFGVQGIISPDGKRVATWDGGRIRLWNATTGRPTGAVLPAAGASFSPDGKLLVTTEFAKTTFWRVSDGRRVPSPIKPASAFGAPVYSLDGTLVAAADGKRRVRVWDDGIVRIYSCIACGSAEHLVELVKARLARARDAQRKKP